MLGCLQVDPDLVFFQAGIDPIESDRLGQLKLTRAGLRVSTVLASKAARQDVEGSGPGCEDSSVAHLLPPGS